jgi:hypothetical protein
MPQLDRNGLSVMVQEKQWEKFTTEAFPPKMF